MLDIIRQNQLFLNPHRLDRKDTINLTFILIETKQLIGFNIKRLQRN